jgi:IS605 OrfB family transposase
MNETKTFSYQTRCVLQELEEAIFSDYANLYASVEHHLFRDLIKKVPINTLKKQYITQYGITARQFNACRVSLEGKIASIKAAREGRIENVKERISSLEKKLSKIKNEKIQHEKKRRLISMKRELETLQIDHRQGNIPLCFGGKKLFHAQFHLEENGYASPQEWKEDWKKVRSSEFFCLGSKDETCGNQSCTLTIDEKDLCTLRLRLPNALAKKHGIKYLFLRNISFAYGQDQISQALLAKKALSYRFKKDDKGWRVFISFTREKTPILTRPSLGAFGVDINANHIAVTEIDAKGNPIDKKTFPLCTYGRTKDQTKALIGDVCKNIVALALEKQKPIIAEKLDFKKKKASLKEESSSKLARMLSSLSYSHILENLERKAFQTGVEFFTVNPALTSIIGRIKFAKRYGLSTHHAAALCIARRFYQFSESPSKCSMKVVHKNVQVTCPLPVRNRRQHVWKFWIEASKKLKAALAAHCRVSPDPRYCRSG